MRTRILSLAVLTIAAACGGGNAASTGAKGPDDVDGGGPVPSSSVAPVEDAGPPTTTTSTLGGGGDSPTKLDPATSGSAAPAPSGSAHAPDPGRSAKDIEALVKAHRDEARKCYDDNIKAHPGVEGDLVVHWVVDAKGAVKTIELNTQRSQITEPTIVGCVLGIVKAIQFAPSAKGFESTYNYPFNFHPKIR